MTLNLIADPWLPVRRLSGAKAEICPCDITSDFVSDPILALDFPRPDWNAAVTELLIGLLATVMAPDDTKGWANTWAKPPSPADLEKRLAPLAFAFNLGGDGPRCFQDLDPLLKDWKQRPIEWLVLAGPVENTQTLNTDLFAKRGQISSLGASFAAAALITQQTYAPEGGPGFRTSMRGGGPLTTLALPRRRLSDGHVGCSLWELVWANAPHESWCRSQEFKSLPCTSNEWSRIFPWLAPTRTSSRDEPTTLDDAHALQAFFGMPCRIRLDVIEHGDCTFHSPIRFGTVSTWWTRRHGAKYESWKHPLSPYEVKASGIKSSAHFRRGADTYRDWLKWADRVPQTNAERAACVDLWGDRITELRRSGDYEPIVADLEVWQSSIIMWGYDFKQNKARGWLEARIPYFDPPLGAHPDAWPQHFRTQAANLVEGADAAASQLRNSIKVALTGKLNRDGRYMADENLPRDAFSDVVERFWRETETEFRDALATLRRGTAADPNDPKDTDGSVRSDFLKALRKKALDLFDEIIGVDLMDKEARRIVEARTRLLRAFNETGSVQDALDIMTEEARQRKKARKSKRKEAA